MSHQERIAELEARCNKLTKALAYKSSDREVGDSVYIAELETELAKRQERIAWLEERKLGDEVLLQNRLIGLTDQDRIIEEINAENLELIGKLAKGRPHLNGSWMAPDGTCRVCGGELPHGHGKCDYYELEKKLKRLEDAAIADSVNKAGGRSD